MEGGLISFLLDPLKVDRLDADVSRFKSQFLSTFRASAIKALDDFVWRSQLNAFKKNKTTLHAVNSLRHRFTLPDSYDRIQKHRN
jgi:hypothetical protein